MRTSLPLRWLAAAFLFATAVLTPAASPIASNELLAPRIEMVGGNIEFTVEPSVSGRRYQLQQSETLLPGSWVAVGGESLGNGGSIVVKIPRESGAPRKFYRFALDSITPLGTMVFIPGGTFQMGNALSASGDGYSNELPVHSVYINGFYLQNTEVTKAQWDAVRAWGLNNGYVNQPTGGGKAANHPVHSIDWYEMVKYCNARSQMEGLTPCYTTGGVIYKTGSDDNVACNWTASGYRLPTEAEWEKAARGGLGGKRFPWGNTITHSLANYASDSSNSYDISPTRGYHPSYNYGVPPYTSPVGSFAANGYGLYDMVGNLREWCWDRYSESYYSTSPGIDPRGPALGWDRVSRGGGWYNSSVNCRAAFRNSNYPPGDSTGMGFRPARSSAP